MQDTGRTRRLAGQAGVPGPRGLSARWGRAGWPSRRPTLRWTPRSHTLSSLRMGRTRLSLWRSSGTGVPGAEATACGRPGRPPRPRDVSDGQTEPTRCGAAPGPLLRVSGVCQGYGGAQTLGESLPLSHEPRGPPRCVRIDPLGRQDPGHSFSRSRAEGGSVTGIFPGLAGRDSPSIRSPADATPAWTPGRVTVATTCVASPRP